jgi:hypothetical protein
VSIRAVLLFCAPPAAGVVAGYLLGGRLRRLAEPRWRSIWLLWSAAVLEFVGVRLPTGVPGVAAVSAAFVLAAMCIARNLRGELRAALSGAVVLMGAATNAVAALTNGGMPYSTTAAAAAEVTAADATVKNVAASSHTRLAQLGDIIPVPPLHAVVSIGDLTIAVGVVMLTAVLMRGNTRRFGSPGRIGSNPMRR